MTNRLLDEYRIPYISLSKQSTGILGLAKELIAYEYKLRNILKDNEIAIALSIGGTFVVHICKMLNIPSISFSDTEHAKIQNHITYPFSTTIVTPSCYKYNLGPKQIRYNSYHELAYLHPENFVPDKKVLDSYGIENGKPYFIIRFVSWEAGHDIGQKGLSIQAKRELIQYLNKRGKVLITSESPLLKEFEPYRMMIPPHKIHDLLAFATLYVGEGGTMASEAAVLGTPSMYINTLTMGYIEELEHKYQLLFRFEDYSVMLKKIKELLSTKELKEKWKEKRRKMLADKIDVTSWMVDFIEKRFAL